MLTDAVRQPADRDDPRVALLDAAERLLVEAGYPSITTRRLAQEAGVNHGLVHYYFGSMENLLAETLDRFTGRLVERQRAMYSAPGPFLDKWRTAMSYLEEDRESGYQKIWLELQALAWNNPNLRDRVARVNAEWRAVVRDAISDAAREYRVHLDDAQLAALTAFVETFNLGMILQRHAGVTEGHRELLDEIERRLESLRKEDGHARAATRRKRIRRA